MNTMIIEIDMACDVIYKEDDIDLAFENGDVWSNPEFEKFGVEIYSAQVGFNWPQICLKGTESQLRAYLYYYDWDDIDFIIKERRVDY